MIKFPLPDLAKSSNDESVIVAISYLYDALLEICSQLEELNKELMRKI